MRSLLAVVSTCLALTSCATDGTSGPLAQPPALLAAPVATLVELQAPLHRLDLRAVGRSPQHFSYGDCSDNVLDRRTDSGWEPTTITGIGGLCGELRLIGGVGFEATIPVYLGHRPDPGVYRIRMEFDSRAGRVVATSNAFVIE